MKRVKNFGTFFAMVGLTLNAGTALAAGNMQLIVCSSADGVFRLRQEKQMHGATPIRGIFESTRLVVELNHKVVINEVYSSNEKLPSYGYQLDWGSQQEDLGFLVDPQPLMETYAIHASVTYSPPPKNGMVSPIVRMLFSDAVICRRTDPNPMPL